MRSQEEATMLDTTLKTQLQSYLERLVHPIELVLALDAGAKSQELRELVHEIAALSDRIAVSEDAQEPRRPSFAVKQVGSEARVRFAGLPLGHEFTSLVLALLQVSGYAPKVAPELIAQIRALPAGFSFESYVSLSCHNCPDVVQALNLMAVINPGIRHTMVDGALFQAEVDAKQIMAVPSVFLNGQPFGQGRMTLEEILARVDVGAATREAAKIAGKQDFEVLIVGGGPAGAAAAIYAARKGIRTGVVADRFGGQVLDTLAIENFISVPETEGPKMAAALEQHVRTYDVDIMNGQRAELLIENQDGLYEVHLANGASVRSRSIVLATGARWREMNVPGEQEYRGRGVAYCPHCDGPLFKGKRVAVVGGGNSGVEAAIDLAGVVAHVTLLEFDGKLRADAVLQKKLASLPNVTVIVSAQTTEVQGDGQKVNALVYQDRGSGTPHRLALDGVFVQIGLLPNTDWLKDTLNLTPRGEIIVDARGQTSLAGVFAAGDATTAPYKQIIIAMGEGAKAALGAFDHLIRTPVPEVEEVSAA
jgi:alkyl hydroperoxide reductase subunit F